jgi:hypothetical protein
VATGYVMRPGGLCGSPGTNIGLEYISPRIDLDRLTNSNISNKPKSVEKERIKMHAKVL